MLRVRLKKTGSFRRARAKKAASYSQPPVRHVADMPLVFGVRLLNDALHTDHPVEETQDAG
jgi:hypothetical protein